MTGNKKYTDKLNMKLTPSNTSCIISSCSESQITSYADFSTNYCNMHVLYCGSQDNCPIVTWDFNYSEAKKASSGQVNANDCIAK